MKKKKLKKKNAHETPFLQKYNQIEIIIISKKLSVKPAIPRIGYMVMSTFLFILHEGHGPINSYLEIPKYNSKNK